MEYQLSWFGKKYFEDDDTTFADKEKAKKKFLTFLESYSENSTAIVSKEEMNEFSKNFIELFDAAFGKSDQNSRDYKAQKMNTLWEKQNIYYKIEDRPQAGPWTVIRFDRSSKKS